ncbi:MAG: type II toxin-antitoxin system VapC family toxin, partial [Egibacteraceae bacterium]
MLYVDTSALVRAYFADEVEHDALVQLLRTGRETVATSSLTVVEAASAFRLAVRTGRLTEREGRSLLRTCLRIAALSRGRSEAERGFGGKGRRNCLRYNKNMWRLPDKGVASRPGKRLRPKRLFASGTRRDAT